MGKIPYCCSLSSSTPGQALQPIKMSVNRMKYTELVHLNWYPMSPCHEVDSDSKSTKKEGKPEQLAMQGLIVQLVA